MKVSFLLRRDKRAIYQLTFFSKFYLRFIHKTFWMNEGIHRIITISFQLYDHDHIVLFHTKVLVRAHAINK